MKLQGDKSGRKGQLSVATEVLIHSYMIIFIPNNKVLDGGNIFFFIDIAQLFFNNQTVLLSL
jgi:hypothetical protein